MKNYFRSIIVIAFSLVLDLVGKVIFYDKTNYILLFEAILFLSISALFFYFLKWKRSDVRKVNRLELVLFYFYLLGSVRVILIMLGATVYLSNTVLIILSLLLFVYHTIIKRILDGNKKNIQN